MGKEIWSEIELTGQAHLFTGRQKKAWCDQFWLHPPHAQCPKRAFSMLAGWFRGATNYVI